MLSPMKDTSKVLALTSPSCLESSSYNRDFSSVSNSAASAAAAAFYSGKVSIKRFVTQVIFFQVTCQLIVFFFGFLSVVTIVHINV